MRTALNVVLTVASFLVVLGVGFLIGWISKDVVQ